MSVYPWDITTVVSDLLPALFKVFLGKYCCDGTVYCSAGLILESKRRCYINSNQVSKLSFFFYGFEGCCHWERNVNVTWNINVFLKCFHWGVMYGKRSCLSQTPYKFCFSEILYFPVFSKAVYNWHVHIQLSRGCVWRPRSVAVREQGRLPDNFIKKMNHLVSVSNIQWCDSLKLPLPLHKAVCALWPAMWIQAKTSVGKISTCDRNRLPIHCSGMVFLCRSSLL